MCVLSSKAFQTIVAAVAVSAVKERDVTVGLGFSEKSLKYLQNNIIWPATILRKSGTFYH